MKHCIFGAAAFVLATAASAAPPPEQPAEQGAERPAQPERKVCRTERATGSLTRRTRICLTAAQWREVNDRTRRGLDDLVRGASGGCAAPRSGNTMCGG